MSILYQILHVTISSVHIGVADPTLRQFTGNVSSTPLTRLAPDLAFLRLLGLGQLLSRFAPRRGLDLMPPMSVMDAMCFRDELIPSSEDVL